MTTPQLARPDIALPQPEDDRISDWALLRRRGGRRLIVSLSGVDCPPGSFAYYNSLALPDSDQLLLNSPDNGWYFGGVPLGQSETSLETTWAFLQNISTEYDETVLIGGSMGAYGALLYGCELPKAHVLAMSPEVYPGIRRGYFNNLAKVKQIPLNLSTIFAKRPGFKPWIVVGEKKVSDLFCLSEVNSPRVLSLRNGYHHVPSVLHAFFGGLGNIVAPLVAGELPQRLQPLIGQMTHWPELSALMYMIELGRVPLERCCAQFEALPFGFYGRGYLALMIAALFERQNKPYMALRYAALARDANPDDIETHAVHDRLWAALHGAPPVPCFQHHIDPLFDSVVNYQNFLAELRALHGMTTPETA